MHSKQTLTQRLDTASSSSPSHISIHKFRLMISFAVIRIFRTTHNLSIFVSRLRYILYSSMLIYGKLTSPDAPGNYLFPYKDTRRVRVFLSKEGRTKTDCCIVMKLIPRNSSIDRWAYIGRIVQNI